MNEHSFESNLSKLFDIASKNALNEIKNEEHRPFLLMQRKNSFSCSMSGHDKVSSDKEARKRFRDEKSLQYKTN